MTGAVIYEVEAPRAPQVLRPVPLTELMTASAPALAHVVRGLIPAAVVTLLAGNGGAGKSILALTLTAHVAAGAHAWAGFAVDDGPALFVSLEDPGDIVRYRLRLIADAYGLDIAKIQRRLTVLDGTGADATLATEVNDAGVRRLAFTATLGEIADNAAGKRLIVIDNASDAFAGNENERRQVRQFIRALTDIAAEHNAGLVLLSHVDKHAARNGAAGSTYSGSTAWHNSVRARLALIAADGAVQLIPEKMNHGKLADPIPLAWTDTGVLVPAGRAVAGASVQADEDAVMEALRAAWAAGVDVGAARTGPSTTQSVLATFAELPQHLHGPRGRRAFWAALDGLTRGGRVKVDTITTDQRKKRKVIVECANCAGPESARANSPHPYALNSAHGVRGFCAGSAPIEPTQTSAAESPDPDPDADDLDRDADLILGGAP